MIELVKLSSDEQDIINLYRQMQKTTNERRWIIRNEIVDLLDAEYED